jgi:hypothetical protein
MNAKEYYEQSEIWNGGGSYTTFFLPELIKFAEEYHQAKLKDELPTEGEMKEAFYDSEAFKWAKIGNTTLSANRAWNECLDYVTNLLKDGK